MLLLGSLPAGSKTKNKAGTVEIYTKGRYFTVTSQHLVVTPPDVEDRQSELTDVWERHIGSEQDSNSRQRSVTRKSQSNDVDNAALVDMLKILPSTSENDGSSRLFSLACRVVEHDLSDESAIATIRAYEKEHPFPKTWGDQELLQRVRDAEKRDDVQRGSVIRRRTDLGNAERFRDQHGHEVRYCHPWGKWLVWDGIRWKVDDSGEIMRRAKKTARSIYAEAARCESDEESKKLASWGIQTEKSRNLAALVSLAKSELPISVEELDSDPWLLNCKNGTVDLRTGKLLEHCREHYLTKCTPVDWSDVTPELWITFLNQIFDSDQEMIRFVQQLMGISLVGEVKEHLLPIFYGSGANGKSVLVSTWLGLLGEYGAKAPASLLMASKSRQHPTDVASLFGKRFVAASETDDGCRLSEALVKDLTGGEKITARRMREDFWEFNPTHTFALSTNYKPIVRGTDNGIWRRVKLVPFTVTIPKDEQDPDLPNKLRAEWSAILSWAVAGCLDWQENGLVKPKEVLVATSTYQSDMDLFGKFIEECCKVSTDAEIPASKLYDHYKVWAAECGEYVQSQTMFGTRLGERGFTRKRISRGKNRGRYAWSGIGISA